MGGNIGIARALNISANEAIQAGYSYLLTMDQDSAASEAMIQDMLRCAANQSAVGLISPFHQDRNAPKVPPETDVEPIVVAMTSGNLLNLAAYN